EMCGYFFTSRSLHTSFSRDWSSDVCSSDLKNHRHPEMGFAQRFVVHVAGPFRQPVINGGGDGENRAGHQYVMEMRHDKIGIVVRSEERRVGVERTSGRLS